MAPATDAGTRRRVARSILQHGPSTAAALAERLSLTPAAVRRHLGVLMDAGQLEARERRVYGQRGRGRPAKVFVITDAGRSEFHQAYEDLALRALNYLVETNGPGAIERFAERLFEPLAAHFAANREAAPDATCAEALAAALDEQGFAASVQPVASGHQICQYHCPIVHVAEQHPQLCQVETRLFADLLGSHVQRLATIAHGDGVCTTHIPRPVARTSTRKTSERMTS